MISLFDSVREVPLPVDLIAREMRGMSLLEFVPLTKKTEAKAEAVPPVSETETPVDERALQVAAMIDAARDEAGTAMRQLCETEFTARLQVERERSALLCAELNRDRRRYLAEMEAEIVRLALAVAKRILLREVEADRMYLTAIVRAALARVHDGSRTTLRVHPGETLDWVELSLPEVGVVGDDKVAPGECVLETSIGRVELGVRPQLDAIEASFQELANWREA